MSSRACESTSMPARAELRIQIETINEGDQSIPAEDLLLDDVEPALQFPGRGVRTAASEIGRSTTTRVVAR